MQITNHKLEGVQFAQTPNMAGGIVPKFIVMHFTCMMNRRDVVTFFQNPESRVSAHLVLGVDGTFTQMVPFNIRAWHAGPSFYAGHSDLNAHSIGIEICNYGECNSLTPDGKYVVPRRGESLPQEYRNVEDWLKVGNQWWQKYTEAQFKALDDLVPALAREYKIRDVCGHSDVSIPHGRKNDPGPAFPMAHYKAFVDYGNSGSMGYYVATVDDLNVRGGPGTDFAILVKLRRGDSVKVLNTQGEWFLVQADKFKGYVHSGFLMKT